MKFSEFGFYFAGVGCKVIFIILVKYPSKIFISALLIIPKPFTV